MRFDQVSFDYAFNRGDESAIDYPDDCDRIRSVAIQRFGISMSRWQACRIWEEWSESMCAGWLHLDDDEEIDRAIRRFIEKRFEDD